MLPGERHHRILELLNKNKSITVKMLCDTLEASEATIRRDLTTLEAEDKLKRTHGGAMIALLSPLEYEASFYQKETLFPYQKRGIAQKAFDLLRDSETIILDAGTTTLELAILIGQSDLSIRVITNSTMVSKAISQNQKLELIMVGGKVRLNTLATVGFSAIETIRKFNVSKSFIGVNGITIDNGLTTPDMEEAETKRAMLSVGRERIVLTDHSKFNRVATCQIAPISMVDYIITDRELEEEYIKVFEQNDIKVILG